MTEMLSGLHGVVPQARISSTQTSFSGSDSIGNATISPSLNGSPRAIINCERSLR
jgi:hypothetical protein